jgi:hypothetical protein
MKMDTSALHPWKYIKKMLSNYEQMFGMLPKDAALPLEKGNHPELDSSDLLDLKGSRSTSHS